MTITINFRAVRAFNRVWQPISDNLEYGAHCDAQFDGGEWSSAISGELYQATMEATARKVGARFGLTDLELLNQVQAADYEEQTHWMIPSLLRKQAG